MLGHSTVAWSLGEKLSNISKLSLSDKDLTGSLLWAWGLLYFSTQTRLRFERVLLGETLDSLNPFGQSGYDALIQVLM